MAEARSVRGRRTARNSGARVTLAGPQARGQAEREIDSAARLPLIVVVGDDSGTPALAARLAERAGHFRSEVLGLSELAVRRIVDCDVVVLDASAGITAAELAGRCGLCAPILLALEYRQLAAFLQRGEDWLGGADDLLVWRGAVWELVLRVRVVLEAHRKRSVLRAGGLSVSLVTRRASHGRTWVELTPNELLTFMRLLERPGCWVPTRKILTLFGVAHADGVARQHLFHLGKKLAPLNVVIEGRAGKGYRVAALPTAQEA